MKKITADRIGVAREIYGMLPRWQLAKDTLNYFFGERTGNSDLKVVLGKVCMIDHLYGTNTKNPIGVAEHIVGHDIDQLLMRRTDVDSSLKVVDKIAQFDGKNLLSFASKYCHFHNHSMFPIFDKFVSVALNRVAGNDIWKKSSRDYSAFRNAILEVSGGHSFEDIDVYLWIYGMRLALESKHGYVNKEVNIRGRFCDIAILWHPYTAS